MMNALYLQLLLWSSLISCIAYTMDKRINCTTSSIVDDRTVITETESIKNKQGARLEHDEICTHWLNVEDCVKMYLKVYLRLKSIRSTLVEKQGAQEPIIHDDIKTHRVKLDEQLSRSAAVKIITHQVYSHI